MVKRFCLMCSDLTRAAENRYIVANHLFIDWWLWLEGVLKRTHTDRELSEAMNQEGYRVRFGQLPQAGGKGGEGNE